jgi:hypothetical protein
VSFIANYQENLVPRDSVLIEGHSKNTKLKGYIGSSDNPLEMELQKYAS